MFTIIFHGISRKLDGGVDEKEVYVRKVHRKLNERIPLCYVNVQATVAEIYTYIIILEIKKTYFSMILQL